jgi:hypoxanthine phosphoribosyltransferase
MLLLIFLPGLIVLVAVAVSCYRNRHELFQLAVAIHNNYAFSHGDRAEFAADLDEISSEDPRISQGGVQKLIEYARSLQPDWVLGVNTGGRVLSSQVCKAIELNLDRCRYVRYDVESEVVSFAPELEEQMAGTLLVIDDISRTGDTLGSIKSYLMEHNGTDRFQLTTVRFAVLVIDPAPKEHDVDFAPDWACYKTSEGKNFKFAWTPLVDKIKAECRRKKAEREQQQRANGVKESGVDELASQEERRLATDPAYAASQFEKFTA